MGDAQPQSVSPVFQPSMLASVAPCVAGDVPDEPSPSPLVPAAERARQRELASYLVAASISPDTIRLDTTSSEGIKTPVNSFDPILTGLVQLGPLRLNCDRSFLSLIDGKTQWIVAEATRSTPLAPGPAEGLYLGAMMMDSSWGVCPNTMNVFTDETGELEGDTGNILAERRRFIIRDFHAEDNYRERPYVKGYPFMRSYFEVPIVSPLGYVIGGYCVVDNTLRDFENDESFRVLTEISSTIMAHLEGARRQHNHSRSERLIRGLDTFIQEETNVSLARSSTTEVSSMSRKSSAQDNRISELRNADLSSVSATSSSCGTESTFKSSQDQLSVVSFHAVQSSTPSDDVPPVQQLGENQEMRRAFQRSAELIREAMNMDGMVFLDACPIGSLGKDASISQYDLTDSFDTALNIVPEHQNSSETVPVLASSVIARDRSTPQHITEGLLSRVIRRHKQGSVFSADEYGAFEKRSNPLEFIELEDPSPGTGHSAGDEADVAELFRHFPTARSIVLLPMWHFQKEKWFAAAIGWTSDSTKSFDLSDVTYLSAFANSIMAEVLRLETLAVSKAKSDFISSISHELRSPLHGILATTELLRETIVSREELSLLEMVSSSGTTLLDTMEHLLEHAKINGLAHSRNSKSIKDKNSAREAPSVLVPCDLANLIEGVVQDAVMGHTKHSAAQSSSPSVDPNPTISSSMQAPPPIVMIDIQAGQNWHMMLEVGAWKRIILNLLGNALKYTTSGSIEVRLTVTSSDSGEQVVLAIQDTGIGMSEEYQKYHLFSPFQQENPLSVGTGLGLSIVQQIVTMQGGTISVKSQKNVGTLVTIAMPMPVRCDPTIPPGPSMQDARKLEGMILGILDQPRTDSADDELFGPQQSLERRHKMLNASVASMATNWLHMNVKFITSPDQTCDISLVNETLASPDLLPSWSASQSSKPLIILDGTQSQKLNTSTNGTILRLPVGPRRLAQALLDALDQSRRRETAPLAPQRTNTLLDTTTTPPPPSLDSLTISPTQLPTPPHSSTASPTNLIEPHPSISPSLTPSPSSSPHVLVVDDNPINIRILTTLLKRLSVSHASATNGLEALHSYTSSPRPFDVVLMDISMPVMDGFAATREIRKYEAGGRRTRIVALTGLGDGESEREAKRCGMDLFLRKPVKLGVLREVLGQE